MPDHLGSEGLHRVGVAGHGEVGEVTLQHASHPLALVRDGLIPASLEFVVDLSKLRPHPLRDRGTPQPEPPLPCLPAEVRESKEIERLRLRKPRAARLRAANRPNSISRVLSRCCPTQLHGPYLQWTRKVNGKTVSKMLTREQLARYQDWLNNARHLRELTAELENLTIQAVEQAEGWGS
jgi:hypothetical protein